MTINTDTSKPLVRLVQLALSNMGLYTGDLDGIYGAQTFAAVALYNNLDRYFGIDLLKPSLTPAQADDLNSFVTHYRANLGRYSAVEAGANVPAPLIAAIHWREGSGDFNTYLHNGDPLGKPTVDDPKGILFDDWEPAAIDALTRETGSLAASGVTKTTTDLKALCVYAEHFNGLGYLSKGVPSPYVLSGTTGYVSGKYVSDGVYDPKTKDEQIGVLVMLWHLTPASSAV